LKDDRDFSLGKHMTHAESNAHSHIDSAKEELKSAAAGVIEEAKEKVESVVAYAAEKVGEAADHVEHIATK
jgi:vacuolar-type H+-ATPase subunit H